MFDRAHQGARMMHPEFSELMKLIQGALCPECVVKVRAAIDRQRDGK